MHKSQSQKSQTESERFCKAQGACNMKVTILVKTLKPYPTLQRTLLSSANIYTRSRRFFYSVARRPHGNIAEIFALCTTERNNLLFIHMVNNPIVFTILPKALRNIRILLKAPTTPGVARFSTPWIGSLKQAVTAYIIFFLTFQSIWRLACPNEIV